MLNKYLAVRFSVVCDSPYVSVQFLNRSSRYKEHELWAVVIEIKVPFRSFVYRCRIIFGGP